MKLLEAECRGLNRWEGVRADSFLVLKDGQRRWIVNEYWCYEGFAEWVDSLGLDVPDLSRLKLLWLSIHDRAAGHRIPVRVRMVVSDDADSFPELRVGKGSNNKAWDNEKADGLLTSHVGRQLWLQVEYEEK